MNRRLPIFAAVFVLVCAAGFGYTYSIDPVYVANARIQVDAGTQAERLSDTAAFVANETQALTSNEMLEKLSAAVSAHPLLKTYAGVPRLRAALTAHHSPGTSVIELHARGPEREALAELVDAWAAVYLASRGTRRAEDRELGLEDARRNAEALETRVAIKRRELDEFRSRNNIVSPEREENEVAAQMKGLALALNDARQKLIEAESRLGTAKASVAEGRTVYRAQDKSQIHQLEQRVLDLRQKLKDMEVRFTPDYLAMEPSVKVMHANIRQIEQQIEELGRNSQQALLNEAAQEVQTAQKNVARMEAQLGERRGDALRFTSRFADQRAQATELAQLEAELVRSKQRLAQLARSERTREPRYEVLGRASVPDKPAHPDYVIYNGSTLAAALIAGLLAVVLVEFLNPRPRPQTTLPQPIIQIAYPALGGSAVSQLPGGATALPGSPRALAYAPEASLRELTAQEVRAIWDVATPSGRLAVSALICGLTLDELSAMKWSDVDLDAACVELASNRLQAIASPLLEVLRAEARRKSPLDHVATTSAGAPLTVADLAGLVAAAVHDAGIGEGSSVDAQTLRHTYVCFLVRQGVRLSDLEHFVGALPAASFLYYRNLSPGASLPTSAVERVFPGFRSS